MKPILTLLLSLLCLTASASPGQPYFAKGIGNDSGPGPNLVLWWKMDENTGTTVFDSSGQTNTGTVVNPSWMEGVLNYGIYLQGSTAYLYKSNAVSMPTGNDARTYCIWARPAMATQGVLMCFGTTSAHEYFGCYYTPNAGGFGWMFSDSSTSFATGQTNTYDIWYSVIYTYTNGIVSRYINGAFLDSKNIGSLSTPNGNVWIGKQPGGEYYKGVVDDLRVYARVLTTNEIHNIATFKQ